MSDFLGNLVARSLALPDAGAAPAPAVSPRIASRFEPLNPAAPPLWEEPATGEGLESESITFSQSDTVSRDPVLPSASSGRGGGALSREAGKGWGGGDRTGGFQEAPSPTLPRADARERAPSALPERATPARERATEERTVVVPSTPRQETVPGPPPVPQHPRWEDPAPTVAAAPVRPALTAPQPAPRAPEERPRVEPVVRRVEVERVVTVLAPPVSTAAAPRAEAAAITPAPAAPAAPPAFLQPRVEPLEPEPFPARREEPAAPAIHVTIGRIEVRATPAPKAPARERQAARPAVDLEDYLRQRARGDGR